MSVATPPADLCAAWREAIRQAGMRVTPQREALLATVWQQRHATAESIAAALAGSEAPNVSTVYRGLEALERIGLISHAHLGSGSPTYHIAHESTHLHLQCNTCGMVQSMPVAVADSFTAALAEATGFAADLTHAAVYGTCADCRAFAANDTAGNHGA